MYVHRYAFNALEEDDDWMEECTSPWSDLKDRVGKAVDKPFQYILWGGDNYVSLDTIQRIMKPPVVTD